MSISVPPPEFNFTGLFYNPEWWITSSTSLSQAVANTLYLRKTVTDSASALETFNAGIKSTGYDVVTAATTQNMFSTQTANTNLFGSMGAGQTLKLGNQTTAQSVHISNIDCNGHTINNGNNPTTGNLVIGSTQTTGDITLGGSSRTTGAINIYRSFTPLYTSAPTSAQIGYTYTAYTVSGSTTINATATTIGAGFSFPVGTWLAEVQCEITSAASFFQLSLAPSGISATRATSTNTTLSGAISCYIKLTTIVQLSTSATWNVSAIRGSVAMSAVGLTVILTRIA